MLLGYDLGSSSVKATLIKSQTGEIVASATYPKQEMSMISKRPGWAEQKPEDWWTNIKNATQELLLKSRPPKDKIKAIGISYQMHGLVLIDK
ncbi:MAG: carbohydrate kinase, partial [Cyclobacteriaceae bacterium]|nr:carbohydrate kinase [Cyclobacteriaceae bacterium]